MSVTQDLLRYVSNVLDSGHVDMSKTWYLSPRARSQLLWEQEAEDRRLDGMSPSTSVMLRSL